MKYIAVNQIHSVAQNCQAAILQCRRGWVAQATSGPAAHFSLRICSETLHCTHVLFILIKSAVWFKFEVLRFRQSLEVKLSNDFP